MSMFFIDKIPLRAAIALVALVAGAVLVAPVEAQVPSQGGLLFSDNFTTSTPGSDVNADIYSPTRVSGPLAGFVIYDTANATGTLGLDGTGLTIADSGRIGLNYDFYYDLALGGMKISYDFQGIVGSGETVDWVGLFTGCDTSVMPDWADENSNWNAFLQFSNYPPVNWYVGSRSLNDTNGVQYQSGSTGAAFNDTMHHVDVLISDMVDGNPFNNYGVVLFDYYIDGNFIATTWDEWDNADMSNNYIGFLMSSATPGANFTYDNLQIYGNNLLLDQSNQWQGVGGADWTAPGSWTLSTPNAQGANALILFGGESTVNVDQDVVIGNLCLENYGTTISSATSNKITFYANAGENSQLQVLYATPNEISAPIELKNDLDITVIPGATLTLSGTMTAPDGPVNVNITPNSGGYPDSTIGVVTVSGTVNPGGAFNVFGGMVNVAYDGSLTASSVYLGDHKYWNQVTVNTGGTLTTDSVSGDGTLAIYGGTFTTSTAGKPTIDVRCLSLGNYTNYTIEGGETVTAAELLGNYDYTSTLTFDGGTLKVRPDPYGPYGANFGIIGYTDGRNFANLYVTENGANIDLNANGLVVAQGFEDAPSVSAGPVTVSNGIQFSMTPNPAFTGGYIFKGIAAVYAGDDPAWFGTGSVQVLQGSSVTYEPSAGNHVAGVTTNFFLEGPAINPYYCTLMEDWPGSVEIAGTVDVTDATTYGAGDPLNLTEIGTHSHQISPNCYMDISGVITGTGGVQFGKSVNMGAVANGLVYLTGSQPNTFDGPANVTCQIVVLQKDPGVVAIPHDLMVTPIVLGAGYILGNDNQTSRNRHRPADERSDRDHVGEFRPQRTCDDRSRHYLTGDRLERNRKLEHRR